MQTQPLLLATDFNLLPSQLSAMVRRAHEFILVHATKPIMPHDVAAHVRANPSYLARAFRKELGFTMNCVIAVVHVSVAQRLLAETTLPITDIGLASGFNSIPRFNCYFKKFTGMSPTRYRDAKARIRQTR